MLEMTMTCSAMKMMLLEWHSTHPILLNSQPMISLQVEKPTAHCHQRWQQDEMTKTYAIVQMYTQIGANQHGSLKCKVVTGAYGNIHVSACFCQNLPYVHSTDGKPLDLHPLDSLQCPWHCHSMETQRSPPPNQLHTSWYVVDIPHPAILVLSSSSKAQNCMAELWCPVCPHTQDTHPRKGTCYRMNVGSAWPDTHPEGTVPITKAHTQSKDNHHYIYSTHKTSSRPTLTA